MTVSKPFLVPSVGKTLFCVVFMSILLFALSSAMADPTFPPSPTLGWSFDEGTGATAYPTFGNQDGELRLGTGWSSTSSPFSYAGNHSLDFLAKNDYVEFPTHASGATGSLQFWAKVTDMDGSDYYMNSSGGTGGRMYMWVHGTGGATIGLGINAVLGVGNYPRPPDDIWNHFVVVWDEALATDNVKAYITNSLGTNVYPMTSTIGPGNTGTIRIGGTGGATGFAGQLDDVAFWDVALTADDVAWLYQHSITEIPEPTTATLAVLATTGLFLFRRRRKRVPSLG